MASYDLQRLGGVGFQDVVAALAIKEFGPQVRPMGRGKDGGRDLLVEHGRLVWSSNDDDEDAEVWEGTTVFQVKHKQTLAGTQADAAWFWQLIKGELDAWSKPDTTRGDVPDYLVFVTNVRLTPVSGSGGFDTVNANIRRYMDELNDETSEDQLPKSSRKEARRRRRARRDRMSRLRTWRLWDGNQTDGLLDAHGEVRRAFDGFLTAGDVLADLSILSTNVNQEQLATALREHARTALLAERRIYFDEAGGGTKGVPVEEVAIDLPVLVGDPPMRSRVIGYALDHGERVLKPSVTTLGKPRHLVITGAPGNGKSTVAKFLTHAYRSAFVGEDLAIGDDHRETVSRTKDALRAMGVRMPAHRRWPMNVNLAKFALEQGTNEDYTLLRWMAASLTRQTASKNIPPWELKTWLKRWPSFIVLDGLDEVTEPSVRQALVANIETFVAEAESENCDVLVIVTTRPTGYQDEMPQSMFKRIDLSDIAIEDALRYGRLVTEVRVPDDVERREGIIALLEQAARDDGLKRLLRTPLQTLIMSIIAESSGQFSPSRFRLFWGYFQTIEQREQKKNKSSYSRLLLNHSSLVLDLHLRVGLLLQRQAETADGTDAVLTLDELREVAWHVLTDAGYQPSTTDKALLEQIVTAAMHRLVLLTPRPDGGYGFDVRSLQELMAAYALTTGKLEETIPRLRRMGASPHWRNTLLFAIGRYFAEPQPHQKQATTDLVRNLDVDATERLGSVFPVSPYVALEVIDDGMVSEPRYLHPLVAHAMKALEDPSAGLGLHEARMLISAASGSEVVRRLIADGLRAALGGTAISRDRAEFVQRMVTDIGSTMQLRTEVLGLATVRRDQSRSLPDEPVADWDSFSETMHAYSDLGTKDGLDTAQRLIEDLQAGVAVPDGHLEELLALLEDSDFTLVLDEALSHIAVGEPRLMATLRHDLLPGLWRRPVDLGDVIP